ncbi:MAG: hypothetical protein JSR89_17085 [Proteobacteria bacterium]|nr:hypothetical protein [Pseudomonadota bacterium]
MISDEEDWRGPMTTLKMALPEDLNLATAFKGFDFTKVKRDVARKALRPAKAVKKAPLEIEALIEVAANRAVDAASGPSGVAGVRAAKKTLTNRLVSRGLSSTDLKIALSRFEARWIEILTADTQAALLEKMKAWAQ